MDHILETKINNCMKYRNICFTINNYTEEVFQKIVNLSYIYFYVNWPLEKLSLL